MSGLRVFNRFDFIFPFRHFLNMILFALLLFYISDWLLPWFEHRSCESALLVNKKIAVSECGGALPYTKSIKCVNIRITRLDSSELKMRIEYDFLALRSA